MSDRAGYLNEPDLIEEIVKETITYTVEKPDDVGHAVSSAILATFSIMARRGLLNEIGIEQIRKSVEVYSTRN